MPTRIYDKLEACEIPSVDDWSNTLLDQWQWVVDSIEEPQPFFTLSCNDATAHLSALAGLLEKECVKSREHCQVASLELLKTIKSELHELRSDLPTIIRDEIDRESEDLPLPETPPNGGHTGRTALRGDGIDTDDLRQRFSEASSGLLNWPMELQDETWIERPELSQLQEVVSTGESGATVVLGPPGAGKSALLAKLGTTLVADNVTVLAIKGDLLPATVNDAKGLTESLDLPVSTVEAIKAVAKTRPVVVIIDQLAWLTLRNLPQRGLP